MLHMKNQLRKIYFKDMVSEKAIQFIFFFFFLVFIISCSPASEEKSNAVKKDSILMATDTVVAGTQSFLSDCPKLYAEAKRMDSILLKEMEVKTDVANKAIKAFTDFAFYCTKDSLSPIYLIKTAQVAQAINNSKQAQVALDKCIADYPKSTHRSAALFLLAQLYDEPAQLNNETEAKKLYEQIIKEYPKSDWANSAKGALSFIGKSDEQIMEELKKKK